MINMVGLIMIWPWYHLMEYMYIIWTNSNHPAQTPFFCGSAWHLTTVRRRGVHALHFQKEPNTGVTEIPNPTWINMVKQCHVYHPPVITICIGGMFTIPSHGWFMTLFYPHYLKWDSWRFDMNMGISTMGIPYLLSIKHGGLRYPNTEHFTNVNHPLPVYWTAPHLEVVSLVQFHSPLV